MRKLIAGCLLAVVILGFSLFVIDWKEITAPSHLAPKFSEIDLPFTHQFTEDQGYPFLGAAIIDYNNDQQQDIIIGGGYKQPDSIFTYNNNALQQITTIPKEAATYGILSLDVTNDGWIDLLIARDDGVYLYQNNQGEKPLFKETKLRLPLQDTAVPFSITVADLNQDGLYDMYVSTFINAKEFRSATFNDPTHATQNHLFINEGNNAFTDQTKEYGLGINQNTFLSSFVNLNNDGLLDLVAALNTGPVQIFENTGNSFVQHESPTGYGFWMGLAIGDQEGDGDMDLFSTNIGSTIPDMFTKGDLHPQQRQHTEWALLRNDGNFTFRDITKETGLTGYEFSWGTTFADLNLDGQQDLLVAQNYYKWPIHKIFKNPGRLFMQQAGKFIPTTKKSKVSNKYYGQSPLVVDLNGDGQPDLVWINIEGPAKAYLNTQTKPYTTIVMPDTLESVGAKVTLTQQTGTNITAHVIPGLGFMTDQTPELHMPQGTEIEIVWNTGKIQRIPVDQPRVLVSKDI